MLLALFTILPLILYYALMFFQVSFVIVGNSPLINILVTAAICYIPSLILIGVFIPSPKNFAIFVVASIVLAIPFMLPVKN